MKLISLSRGMHAMVDDEDYDRLNQFNWHVAPGRHTFYVQRNNLFSYPNGRKNKKVYKDGIATIKMHRHILNVKDPMVKVDHVDGNALNNQKSNLRACSNAENLANRIANTNSTSKFKGVSWKAHLRKWVAQIKVDQKNFHIGVYESEKEAALAYNVSASFAFREFAKLNEVNI